ncbi:MAG: hypothetical protein IPL47_14670 [Phyllobacteriaceae bacterium]|nr:hypothetical protein [Phyllobacteriaceae bacterium]
MYALIKSMPLSRLLQEQLPVVGIAWMAAELFYKFHSFTLECAAFLGTWFVLDAAFAGLKKTFGRKGAA